MLEDVRVLAFRGDTIQLQPNNASHINLTWMQVKLIERIRAVVIELKNRFSQDSSGDLEHPDVAHDAQCVWLVLLEELWLAVHEGSKANCHIQRKHRDAVAIFKLLVKTARVRNASRRLRLEFATPGALRGAAHRKDTERTDELIIIKRFVLRRDHTGVSKARESSQARLGGGECVTKRKHVRSDGNLKLKLRKEQCAPQNLMPKTLVRKVMTKNIKHRLRVQVRVERGVEIQRHEVAVRVPLPQIPHDTSSSFNKAVLPNNNRFELGLQLARNRQAFFAQLHHSNNRPQLVSKLANRQSKQDFVKRLWAM